MTGPGDASSAIAALRSAVPYLRLFQGRTFVIKGGGESFGSREGARVILEQVGVLHRLGVKAVVVHGGGAQATELARRLGVEPRFVEGRRVTSPEMLEVTTMVLNGSLNTELVAVCRELHVPALGLSGVDASLIQAVRRPPGRLAAGGTLDWGSVGDIETVDPTVIRRVLDDGFVPVVSPLSADARGRLLNVNADTAAGRIAAALKAAKLLYLVDVPGVMRDLADPGSLISYTDLAGLAELERAGSLKGGMLPKAASIREALEGGVERVHVISARIKDSLLKEVFTNEGSGTLIVHEMGELRPEEVKPR